MTSSIVTHLRKYRIAKIALFDVIASYLIAFIILKYVFHSKHPFILSFGVFALGIIVHLALGIPTELNYKLGLSDRPVHT